MLEKKEEAEEEEKNDKGANDSTAVMLATPRRSRLLDCLYTAARRINTIIFDAALLTRPTSPASPHRSMISVVYVNVLIVYSHARMCVSHFSIKKKLKI